MNEEECRELIQRMQAIIGDKYSLFYLCESGSKIYGWSSKDSDIDIRGSFYCRDTTDLFKLGIVKETHEGKIEPNIDYCLHEIRKELGLAAKSNCNILEHFATKPIYAIEAFDSLRDIILKSFGKNGLYNSYKGMAKHNYYKYIKSGKRIEPKKYLYVFRALMAGISALETGGIEPNIVTLNKGLGIEEVDILLQAKIDNRIPKLKVNKLKLVIDKLFNEIDTAYKESNISDEFEDIGQLNFWLTCFRLDHISWKWM